ncbi:MULTISPECIES: BTAD domain-containing putative transcriptional regulator [unclassified Nonomuraea]|uniref:AfsR/SARP family transcriptional regulator n=1 Tax=unclassified Nonomuraea TaxID=2593643 RepID=UPI0033DCFF2B
MISFDLLGLVEVSLNGDRFEITGRKRRSLLVVLLLKHGEVVSVDDLIVELWRGDPPDHAENALHAHVSRLRHTVKRWCADSGVPIELQTRFPGYALLVSGDHIDSVRFDELCAKASALLSTSPKDAMALLRQALELWRGPALQNVPSAPMRDQAAQRLERQRMLMTASFVEISLDMGRHIEIIPQLEALVLRNPLEERLYSQLMSALCRAGRPADALGIYHLARVALAREAGLSPSPALERQMLHILNRSQA